MIEIAKQYAIKCHEGTLHLYDKKYPYSAHLEMVFGIAQKFIHLIPEKDRENVLAACWVHDVIEDCRQTYNDVLEATNREVAELAYALTNEKGKTRKERANEKYYQGIRSTPYATFVKLCDRIANYNYSKEQGGKMEARYKDEMGDFIKEIYDRKYEELFDCLAPIEPFSVLNLNT